MRGGQVRGALLAAFALAGFVGLLQLGQHILENRARLGASPDAPGGVKREIATADRPLLDSMMRGTRAISVAQAAADPEKKP